MSKVFNWVAQCEDISIWDLEKSLGMSRGVLHRAETKGTDIVGRWLFALINKYPNYNYDDLLRGRYERAAAAEPPVIYGAKPRRDGVPVLSSATLPRGAGFAELDTITPDRATVTLLPQVDFFIRITGDGLNEPYLPGSIAGCVIIDDLRFIQWGRVHCVATSSQGILIRRVYPGSDGEHYGIEGDNPGYPRFLLPATNLLGIAMCVGGIYYE